MLRSLITSALCRCSREEQSESFLNILTSCDLVQIVFLYRPVIQYFRHFLSFWFKSFYSSLRTKAYLSGFHSLIFFSVKRCYKNSNKAPLMSHRIGCTQTLRCWTSLPLYRFSCTERVYISETMSPRVMLSKNSTSALVYTAHFRPVLDC